MSLHNGTRADIALNPSACLLRARRCRALAARTAAGYRNVRDMCEELAIQEATVKRRECNPSAETLR